MKTLITPAAVIASAFTDGEYVADTAISDEMIAAAEWRYLRPVVGGALHERLLEGAYADFTAEYVAPVVALYTRIAIQPRLNVRAGQCGLSAAANTATAAQSRELAQSLLAQARALLVRMAEHLELNSADFPEYVSEANILNRCRIDGDLVQIF